MSPRPRPPVLDPADPRFAGLPYSDRSVKRFRVRAPSEEIARLAEGLLASRWWGVHRRGLARSAHGPNGDRWVFAWEIEGQPLPAWADKLPLLPADPPGARDPDGAVR